MSFDEPLAGWHTGNAVWVVCMSTRTIVATSSTGLRQTTSLAHTAPAESVDMIFGSLGSRTS